MFAIPLRRLFCTIVFASCLLWSIELTGQAAPEPVVTAKPAASGARRAVPRTRDGRPRLEGVWNFGISTPLERPKEFANKPLLTDAEAADFLKRLPNDGCRIINCDGSERGKLESAYGEEWWSWGDRLANNRTSLITDPSDGRIPTLTPEAQAEVARRQKERPVRRADDPEDRSIAERCIIGFNAGPPVAPGPYNNMLQIVQSRDHIAITTEMIHSTRIIPLTRTTHLPQGMRQWMGDSVGRWEGDTLVIVTRNFRRDSQSRSVFPEGLTLVERLTRVDANTLNYSYTMQDSRTWTRPWTVEIPLDRKEEQVFEYACHEGNYAMEHMLRAARSEEQRGVQK